MLMNTVLNAHKHICHVAKNQSNSRHFYKWLIIMFNGINKRRIEEVGPDRACAEWLLRNGAAVQFKGMKEYLKNYNLLPKVEERFHIHGVDASDSAIHHLGFQHFFGCKYIEDIKLVRCSYIEDGAIPLLAIVRDSLKNLEVVECKNITDEALLHLRDLKNLETLKLGGFPYVKNKDDLLSKLTAALPNCKISYDE